MKLNTTILYAMKSGKDDINSTGPTAVAGTIRGYIKKNNLQEGDRLPTHAVLSKKLGIGMRRLREGLSILEQEGLIITRRKGGTQVDKPSLKILDDSIGWHLDVLECSFEDVVNARAGLEGVIAAEAARRRSARDLLVMLDAIERMEIQEAEGELRDYEDESFHLAILAATHNPAMQIFGQLIHGQFQRKAKEHVTATRRRQKASIEEHRAVYTDIEKRDFDSAREHMHIHILRQLKEKRNEIKRKAVYSYTNDMRRR